MPNHVTNHLTLYGDPARLDAFMRAHVIDEHLSFQSILPMPAILDGIPASTAVDDAIEALTGVSKYDRSSWTQEERDRHAARLLALSDDDIAMGRRALDAKRQTGHISWYGWCNANWNTKWDAYHGSVERRGDDELFLQFDTAWDIPEPVLHKLAELWPDLEMTFDALDECDNFGVEGARLPNGPWTLTVFVPEPENEGDEDDEDADEDTAPA